MEIIEGYMPYLGYKTYYRIVGKKTEKAPLLLLHGGPGSTHNYFEVLDDLDLDRQIIMYDQLGCGNSYIENHPELWNMETWMNELKALREYLNLDEVFILGQSWGGMLLLEYVCKHHPVGVKGIILSSTLPSSKLWAMEQARMIRELDIAKQTILASDDYNSKEYQDVVNEYMIRHAAGEVDENTPECVARKKQSGTESYVVGWGPNEFTPLGTLKDYDVCDYLKDITIPTLVINGTNDLCTPWIAKYMYDRIPNCKWELFRDCRHMCFVEDNKHYKEVLTAFIKEIEA